MKKIILFSGILFSTIFFLDRSLSFAIDYFIEEVQYGQKVGKINYYLSRKTPDLLFVGNSRVRGHVIPDSFSLNTFVLAHNGMHLSFNVGLISILKNEGKLPKRLCLQLEPHFFSCGELSYKRDIQHLKHYYGKNQLITQYINQINETEKLKYLFHLYKYNSLLPSIVLNYFKTKKQPPSYGGFEGTNFIPSDTFLLEKQLLSKEKYKFLVEKCPDIVHNDIVNKEAIKFIDTLLDLLKGEDTELILFTAPYYKKYYKDNSQEIEDYLKLYLQKKGIIYLNYNKEFLIDELEDKKCWKDLHHMNINGAKIFTADLEIQLNLL